MCSLWARVPFLFILLFFIRFVKLENTSLLLRRGCCWDCFSGVKMVEKDFQSYNTGVFRDFKSAGYANNKKVKLKHPQKKNKKQNKNKNQTQKKQQKRQKKEKRKRNQWICKTHLITKIIILFLFVIMFVCFTFWHVLDDF